MCPALLLVLAGCSERPTDEPTPAPDVFIADLNLSDPITIGVPENVTMHPSYDNQPSFTADGTQLLYTGQRNGQTDIYRYHLATRRTEPVTRTAESEYSPTPLPSGRGLSTVRVEQDSTQRLWAFEDDGTDPRVLLPDIAPVGYHAWVDTGMVALFVLGTPPTLQLANVSGGPATTQAEDIGRSLHRIPGERAVSYVRKLSDGEWWIVRLDVDTLRHTRLIETLPGREDYAWTPNGLLLMADSTSLYRWDPDADDTWVLVADLSAHGLGPITRLAVSPDGNRLALVSDVVQ